MKKRYLLPIICFLLPLVFFLVYSICDSDKTFSDSENRELATFPRFSAESYADASFMQNFETYYNDQFPFREQFIKLAKLYNSIMFPDFLLSDDDVLELNSSIVYKGRILEKFSTDENTVTRYATIVNRLYEECGKPEAFVLVPPPPFDLYAPKSYIGDNNFDKAFEFLCEKLEGPKPVDLRKAYSDNKYEYLYFGTDHHWTARGAHLAASEFLKTSEGEELPPVDEYKSGVRENFLGSLYKAVMTEKAGSILENNPDKVEYFYPFADATITAYSNAKMENGEKREVLYPEYSETSNLYCIFMGGDMALGKIETETKNGKSILVVRDSYGHAIVPFLIDAYETIYTVEPRYFNEANKLELGRFFKDNDIGTLLFVGYPQMTVGSYWDTMAKYMEYLVNIE